MSKNFEGIKTKKFGIEIEMTGLTRSQAAKAMANVLDGRVEHEGGSYDKYVVTDSKNRKWAMFMTAVSTVTMPMVNLRQNLTAWK